MAGFGISACLPPLGIPIVGPKEGGDGMFVAFEFNVTTLSLEFFFTDEFLSARTLARRFNSDLSELTGKRR